FTGREWDPETGLYYYRARYYDPKTGRFVREDPIGLRGSDINFYAYVRNNPVNWTDPYGLQFVPTVPPGWWDFWTTYWDMDWRRRQGHQRFPGQPNSFMRHCVVNCEAVRAGHSST